MGNIQTPQIKDAPRHIVIFINGARTRLFPTIVDPADDYDTILAELAGQD